MHFVLLVHLFCHALVLIYNGYQSSFQAKQYLHFLKATKHWHRQGREGYLLLVGGCSIVSHPTNNR